MNIHSEDIFDFSEELHVAMRQGMQWFAYDTHLESVTARDIDVFETEKEASAFKAEKESFDENFQVLPIETVSTKIDELIIQSLHESDEYPDVEIDISELPVSQAQLEFAYMSERLEEMMDSFDWSKVFYDPLEANTEAESIEDKNEFNRLEILLKEMKSFSEKGDESAALVGRLVEEHWRGNPMESQISDFTKEVEPVSMVGESSQVVSDDVLALANIAMSNGEHWMAYNGSPYFIDKDDVAFFKSEVDADAFSRDNISDRDHFNVIEIYSVADILKRIPYGRELAERIDPDSNPLYNKDGNAFTDALIDHFEQSKISNNKINNMNENNLKYLKDNLKYTGFGEALNGELEKNIKEQKPEFQLHFTTELNNKPFNATLNFRKGDNSDMYFFNSYKASIERNDGQKVEQTFQIKKGKGINGKEAYNLLQGRAVYKDMVNKEGQPFKAWQKLNFDEKDKYGNHLVNQFHEKYGYDLPYAVNKFPVLEMDGGEAQEKLLKSLERGNAQSVTIEIDGKQEKFFMEANPERKTVNVYDNKFSMMKHEDLPLNQREEKPQQQQSQGQVQEPQQKQAMGQNEKPGEQKQGAGVKNGEKQDGKLLKKKRVGQKKGVKM